MDDPTTRALPIIRLRSRIQPSSPLQDTPVRVLLGHRDLNIRRIEHRDTEQILIFHCTEDGPTMTAKRLQTRLSSLTNLVTLTAMVVQVRGDATRYGVERVTLRTGVLWLVAEAV